MGDTCWTVRGIRATVRPMAIPALKSEILGGELQALHADDGPRLRAILDELRVEVERDRGNLITSTVLINALVLAGQGVEARREIRRSLALWRSLPAVPPDVTMNVIAGLAECGFAEEAKELIVHLDRRALDPRQEQRRTTFSVHVAARYGELDWFASRHPDHPLVRFLVSRGLAESWSHQQAAVEGVLAERVVTFGSALVPVDGSEQLFLDYYTDTMSIKGIDWLQERVWDAVEASSGDRYLGQVAFIVRGPEIPIEEMTP